MPKPARPELDGFLDKQLQVRLDAAALCRARQSFKTGPCDTFVPVRVLANPALGPGASSHRRQASTALPGPSRRNAAPPLRE